MGTVNFTVGKLNRDAHLGVGVLATTFRTSANHTSTTSASNLQASSADITLTRCEYIRVVTDEDGWINFGGNAAAVGTGFHMAASTIYEWQCEVDGKVSVIDVA